MSDDGMDAAVDEMFYELYGASIGTASKPELRLALEAALEKMSTAYTPRYILDLNREVERLRGQVSRVEALCEAHAPFKGELWTSGYVSAMDDLRAALTEPEGGE